jgi:glycosyltransferase involved in cell wall biosynthesis
VDVERVEAARSGVDTRRFHPGAGGADRRRELGIPEDAVVLGFCGTFGPWHGVEHLVEAAVKVPPDLPMHYLFVGDGEKRPALQGRLAEAGVTAATFTGLVPLAQMPTYLDACDILACPTRLMPGQQQGDFFGSPTKLFEYMAAGKAIIASDVGQIPEVIDDGRTGILFHEGQIDELRDAIVSLACDAELRDRLGSEARREIVAHGGWRRNAGMAIARAAGIASDSAAETAAVTAPQR